jgi:hypothetical protein
MANCSRCNGELAPSLIFGICYKCRDELWGGKKYYFFNWRCTVCQDIAKRLLADNPSLDLQSHPLAVRERDGQAICELHEATEQREIPYLVAEEELPPNYSIN